jgi:hypothetical protein
MSNSRPAWRWLNRSTRVLLARFHAEVDQHGPGRYYGQVMHDANCPGACSPEHAQMYLQARDQVSEDGRLR